MKMKTIRKYIAGVYKTFLVCAMLVIGLFVPVAICCIALLWALFVFIDAPTGRSDADRFAPPSQELIAALTPYLSSWLSKPSEETNRAREAVGSSIDVWISIDTATNESGESFPVILIEDDHFYTWQRGYLYTDGATDLNQVRISSFYGNFEIRRFDEHWYIYNHNAD
jgi:hypothetical protein